MINNVSGLYKAHDVYKIEERPSAVKKSGRPEQTKDEVALSGRAVDYQIARTALQNAPDVREDVVSAMKSKYSSQMSAVSASDIADKLISKWS